MSRIFGVFNPLRIWKKDDLPVDPVVHIVVAQPQIHGDGEIVLTASLASDQEIDFAVNEMQKDLEEVRREAKRTLDKQREKILTAISERNTKE